MKRRMSAYFGHLEVMHADQGPQFTAAGRAAKTRSVGTNLSHTGIESHNSLGTRERYNSCLRIVSRRVWADHA